MFTCFIEDRDAVIHLKSQTSTTKRSHNHLSSHSFRFSPRIMAPTPDWNPKLIKPIQDAWPKIAPVHKIYMNVLSGLTSIFGFAAAVALVASHKFLPPKWPFTSERWNPKPTVQKKKEEKEKEVTEKVLLEDELAAAASGLVKRYIAIERDLGDEDAFYGGLAKRGTLSPIRVFFD